MNTPEGSNKNVEVTALGCLKLPLIRGQVECRYPRRETFTKIT